MTELEQAEQDLKRAQARVDELRKRQEIKRGTVVWGIREGDSRRHIGIYDEFNSGIREHRILLQDDGFGAMWVSEVKPVTLPPSREALRMAYSAGWQECARGGFSPSSSWIEKNYPEAI